MGTYTHAEKKAITARLMKALLQHGADPYALSHQHFHLYRDFPAFPGQPCDAQFEDEESDLYGGMFTRWALNNRALENARLSSQLIYPSDSWEYDGWDEGTDYEYFIFRMTCWRKMRRDGHLWILRGRMNIDRIR